MAHAICEPRKIDPEAVYSDGNIRLMFDLASATLARARREQKLQFVRREKRIFYRGSWVLDWLLGRGE